MNVKTDLNAELKLICYKYEMHDIKTNIKQNIVIRIPLDLLSDTLKRKINENPALYAKKIYVDNLTTASRKAFQAKTQMVTYDFFKNAKGQIDVCELGRTVFLTKMGVTPATYINQIESNSNSSGVNQVNEGSSSFEPQTKTLNTKNYLTISHEEYNTLFDVNDPSCNEDIKITKNVYALTEKFNQALAHFLGKNRILPEEKIFTTFRSLAFARVSKQQESEELRSFFHLIDRVEFALREFCFTKDPKNLLAAAHLIKSESDKITSQKEVFKNALLVLDNCANVIKLYENNPHPTYLKRIGEFLEIVVHSPLKDQLKSTLSLRDAMDMAKQNLALRAKQLIAQFKFSRIDEKTAIELLSRLSGSFEQGNWVMANNLLSQIMECDFFRQALQLGNLKDEEKFCQYKLAGGIIGLVDFFREVVSCSSDYRWINFEAVNASLNYLQATTTLDKGRLNPLKDWVSAFKGQQMPEIPEAFEQFFLTLQTLANFSRQFTEENGKKFEAWLLALKSGEVDGKSYRELCSLIYPFTKVINETVQAITDGVNQVQSEIILSSGKKGAPQIEPLVLQEQMENLNNKVTQICFPLLSFLHNFNHIFGDSGVTAPTDTVTLFETDPSKLLVINDPDEVTVEIEEDEPIEPEAPNLEKELDQIFREKNRRKLLVNLNDFFKARSLLVKTVSGKGSHIKIYLSGRPIVIPNSKELKVGTAGSIQKEILETLKQMN